MKSEICNPKSFDVIEETPEWIVVDKPPHLQVHPSKPNGVFTLWDGLKELLAFELVNGGQISIINRLDRETSGLTLVCKTSHSARKFSLLMEHRLIHKEYFAIVLGWPKQDVYEIDAPLARQGKHQTSRIWLKQTVHPKGARAFTTVKVEKRFRKQTTNGEYFSLIRAIPKTGRTHQIRVHLSFIGHSVLGDKIYGSDEQNYLDFIETGWTLNLERSLLFPRHALHSTMLRIEDAELKKEWQLSLPLDMKSFVEV